MVFTFVFAVAVGINRGASAGSVSSVDPSTESASTRYLSIRLCVCSRLLDLDCSQRSQRSLLSEELEAQDSASHLEHLPSIFVPYSTFSPYFGRERRSGEQ